MALVGTSPALAATSCKGGKVLYGETCETPKEHSAYQAFANCDFGAPPLGEGYTKLEICVGGESFYKETWESKAQEEAYLSGHPEYHPGQVSYFTAGKVKVYLKNSIALRGGFEGNEKTINVLTWIAAVGAETIQPVRQNSIPLPKAVNKALLSLSELERYDYYVHHAKETKTYATVELAGPAENIKLNLEALLAEKGTAFIFPVKVKLSNPFFGENCYVGSNSKPIDVPFTDGVSGELTGKRGQFGGEPASNEILVDWGQTLVSSSFESPGVEGCGVGGGADEAINSALGLPAATGNTSVLNGVLKLVSSEPAEKALKGEL